MNSYNCVSSNNDLFHNIEGLLSQIFCSEKWQDKNKATSAGAKCRFKVIKYTGYLRYGLNHRRNQSTYKLSVHLIPLGHGHEVFAC
ncbi:hypothetical protein CH54_3617 [Yersinia rochesterensis]|uniref:Transposase n=1 Tax=Yersinia rochesterensis TaxID=1604335 RepID=A0ABN4FCT7_9GAMM|nr:hypothetical protein DJ57_435 [Yersinia rochesterensis]AJI87415.1 hypothetical protein AW19_2169 [Yersinia frederiksenii Y225]AJJ35011.1 hypothetical protein CH54_3617 [Yersinia rochesterensis]CNG90821.1 Uncharacterised protein [Yersinia kristensenii]CRY63540.1 Uncharacterised protein [Yersinia kristensenii]